MTKPILKYVFCCVLICSSIPLSHAQNDVQTLNTKVSVAGQMNAAKFSQLMRQGF